MFLISHFRFDENSPHFFNAVKDRELDLRGNEIVVMENLGATECSGNIPFPIEEPCLLWSYCFGKKKENCYYIFYITCLLLHLQEMSFAGKNLKRIHNWTWSRSWSWRPTRFRPLLPGSGMALSFVLSPIHSLGRFFGFRHNNKPSSPDADTTGIGCSSLENSENGCSEELGFDDLKELMAYRDGVDGGPPWRLMMDRSTPTLSYQAWFRDPQIGPTQYRTRTVFANMSPELIRDFFWDDEFRPKWDDMLIYFSTLDVCPKTGTMIVHWIRKLPLFWNDREYVIGRRIWESESTYYCVTKAKKDPSLPRYENPKRVDSYYSSFCVNAVSAQSSDGTATARGSEVILFHQEDLGIPKDFVKMGVRGGMWRMVKKMDAGVQAYGVARANTMLPLSSYALIASRTTPFSPSVLAKRDLPAPPRLEEGRDRYEDRIQVQRHGFVSREVKWLVMGVIVIACGFMYKR